MDFAEYQQRATLTESMSLPAVCKRLHGKVVTLPDEHYVEAERGFRLLHCSMGLTSEVVEYVKAWANRDVVGCHEETGDQFWYAAIGFNACGTSMRISKQTHIFGPESLIERISLLEDWPKKWLFYGKPIDWKAVDRLLVEIVTLLDWQRMKTNSILTAGHPSRVELPTLLAANLRKLQDKRYKGKGFAEALALDCNRDLEAERLSLEEDLSGREATTEGQSGQEE